LKALAVFFPATAFYTIASIRLHFYLRLFPDGLVLAADASALVAACFTPAETFTVLGLAVGLDASAGDGSLFDVLLKQIVDLSVLCS
jgi:hypothetical protein